MVRRLRTRLAGVVVVLRLSPTPVAKTAHHQRHRALLRRSSSPNPAHGLLCQCRERGPNHLLHFPEIQSGMENPHPQPIYTSSLRNWGVSQFQQAEDSLVAPFSLRVLCGCSQRAPRFKTWSLTRPHQHLKTRRPQRTAAEYAEKPVAESKLTSTKLALAICSSNDRALR